MIMMTTMMTTMMMTMTIMIVVETRNIKQYV